jgi:hypothetical protein
MDQWVNSDPEERRRCDDNRLLKLSKAPQQDDSNERDDRSTFVAASPIRGRDSDLT